MYEHYHGQLHFSGGPGNLDSKVNAGKGRDGDMEQDYGKPIPDTAGDGDMWNYACDRLEIKCFRTDIGLDYTCCVCCVRSGIWDLCKP
jgi:hypothetical protein